MFETTQSLGRAFLDGIWGFFSIYVPGFGFTIGQLWLGVFLCSVSVLVIKLIFGFGSGVSSRTGSTDRPYISEERKRDRF